ncbi:MAG TPA: STAS domain-containing protein [Herpetosiphonaceae bacterium]
MIDASLSPSNPASSADMVQLYKLAQFQETLLKNIPMSITAYDVVSRSDVRLIYSNQDAAATAGLAQDQIIGRRLEDYLLPQEAAHAYKRFQACLDTGAPVQVEDTYTFPNGEFHMELTYIPLRDDKGTISQVLLIVQNMTERKQRLEDEQQRQAELIEQQAATLAELSTPLLAISESTVVMPLIGAIDTRRVQHIMDTLLSGVADRRARTVILDITGVSVVDTQVANALIQSAQAVKLLGAEAVLTGIRPEVAQTLVQLGVSLQGVVTRGTLQDGIAYALQR